LYTQLCSAALFPLHERLKRHRSVTMRRELERTQWLDPVDLERLQVASLRDFLVQAGRFVPYYRELYARCGFRPEEVSSLDDLGGLPFLTKALIRDNGPQLKSERAKHLVRSNTGGSSGEPLVFYVGPERVSHDVAAKWRATRWWGVDIGDREVVLWGSPIELGAQDRLRALRDRVLRSHLLPAFEMSSQKMDEYLDFICRFKPRMVFGYASAIARLAHHAKSRGVGLANVGVRVIFATGETLYPDQGEVIQTVFGAPVANGYGSRDAGFIAHQCPSGSLHQSSEHLVVELVDERGTRVQPGATGEVVVTHLASGDFPFIRYRTGDMAVFDTKRCACGRGLPIWRTVYGRATDFIQTCSGNSMHALALIYEVRDRPGVRGFKFVQAEDLSIELQLAAGPELTELVEREVLANLARRLGPDTPVKIVRVNEILPEKSGKHRYVVSRASSNPGPANRTQASV